MAKRSASSDGLWLFQYGRSHLSRSEQPITVQRPGELARADHGGEAPHTISVMSENDTTTSDIHDTLVQMGQGRIRDRGELLGFDILDHPALGYAGDLGLLEWYAYPMLTMKRGEIGKKFCSEFVAHIPGIEPFSMPSEHPVCEMLRCCHHIYTDYAPGSERPARPPAPDSELMATTYEAMFDDLDTKLWKAGRLGKYVSAPEALRRYRADREKERAARTIMMMVAA